MQVKYMPEDDPSKGWTKEFDPQRVKAGRAEMIERRYGKRYSVWVAEIQAGEVAARRILMWHLLSLDHPQFKLEDVPDFMFGELELDYSVSDLQKLRREVEASAMDDAAKSETLERLDLEIANRLLKETEELTAEDLGKAEDRSVTASSE
jgi:hypothetical protein